MARAATDNAEATAATRKVVTRRAGRASSAARATRATAATAAMILTALHRSVQKRHWVLRRSELSSKIKKPVSRAPLREIDGVKNTAIVPMAAVKSIRGWCMAGARGGDNLDIRMLANAHIAAAAAVAATFTIRIEPEVWDVMEQCTKAMYKSCDDHEACDYQDAMCAFNGEPAVGCKVRRKGSTTWRPMHDRPSWKIKKMKRDDEAYVFGTFPCGGLTCAALEGGGLYGATENVWQSDRLTLNNMVYGNGDVRTYALFRAAGAIAPLAMDVDVTVSRGDTVVGGGKYAMIESVNDKYFMRKHIDRKSYVLWETPAEFKRSAGSFDADGAQYAESRCDKHCATPEECLPVQRLAAFNETLLLRYFEAERLAGHTDGICLASPANNGYIAAGAAGTFVFIPHGTDQTFMCRRVALDAGGVCAPITQCLDDSECRDRLQAEAEAVRGRVAEVNKGCWAWYEYAAMGGGGVAAPVAAALALA